MSAIKKKNDKLSTVPVRKDITKEPLEPRTEPNSDVSIKNKIQEDHEQTITQDEAKAETNIVEPINPFNKDPIKSPELNPIKSLSEVHGEMENVPHCDANKANKLEAIIKVDKLSKELINKVSQQLKKMPLTNVAEKYVWNADKTLNTDSKSLETLICTVEKGKDKWVKPLKVIFEDLCLISLLKSLLLRPLKSVLEPNESGQEIKLMFCGQESKKCPEFFFTTSEPKFMLTSYHEQTKQVMLNGGVADEDGENTEKMVYECYHSIPVTISILERLFALVNMLRELDPYYESFAKSLEFILHEKKLEVDEKLVKIRDLPVNKKIFLSLLLPIERVTIEMPLKMVHGQAKGRLSKIFKGLNNKNPLVWNLVPKTKA